MNRTKIVHPQRATTPGWHRQIIGKLIKLCGPIGPPCKICTSLTAWFCACQAWGSMPKKSATCTGLVAERCWATPTSPNGFGPTRHQNRTHIRQLNESAQIWQRACMGSGLCKSIKVSWKRNHVPMYISITVTIAVHTFRRCVSGAIRMYHHIISYPYSAWMQDTWCHILFWNALYISIHCGTGSMVVLPCGTCFAPASQSDYLCGPSALLPHLRIHHQVLQGPAECGAVSSAD